MCVGLIERVSRQAQEEEREGQEEREDREGFPIRSHHQQQRQHLMPNKRSPDPRASFFSLIPDLLLLKPFSLPPSLSLLAVCTSLAAGLPSFVPALLTLRMRVLQKSGWQELKGADVRRLEK